MPRLRRGLPKNREEVDMFLTSQNLVDYLLERGLVTASQVVDGDYMVVEAPRRNRNFKVMQRDRSGVFLKQVRNWDAQSIGTVQLEAHCYSMTKEDSPFAPLRDIMPQFHFYDERRAVLVTELLGNSETLAECYYRQGSFPDEVATQLGEVFGKYHRQVSAGGTEAQGQGNATRLFPRRAPWILSFHNAAPQMLQQASGGNHQLLGILRGYPAFGEALDRLAAQWKQETLIHGDIKWDNCLLIRQDDGKVRIKLVDWELADWGDPCWDVAAIFSSFLTFWIQSMPLTPGQDAAQAMKLTQYPIEKMQPSMQGFWNAYCAEMGLHASDAKALLLRAVNYCGARTIQTAYEYMQMSPQLNSQALYLLQASMNILLDPEQASGELLGLPIQ